MKNTRISQAWLLALATGLMAVPLALAQEAVPPATQPAAEGATAVAEAPTTQPVIDEAYQATITTVSGKVTYALPGPDGKLGEFQPAKVGDKLPAGARIQTRLRSKVTLQFGEGTVILVDRVTSASIDQFHRSADTKVVKLGLGHGEIRGASVETTLRSDMSIESPTATLSKRGTIGFGMRYDSGTGRYRIFLEHEGLVSALNKLTHQQRAVQPGQYVTQAMTRWIETWTMDRYVAINDRWGTTGAEQSFAARLGSGIGVVDPAAGGTNFNAAFSGTNNAIAPTALTMPPVVPPTVTPRIVTPLGPFNRPEGNFGTGFGASAQ